jgi:cis-3-alkyl-4-acyloxetan-2-one decarboxylase
MLHGNPSWSFYYRRLVLALRDSHRVIVPDHMGCGLSDKPQEYEYRLATHIDNLTALIEHLRLTRFSLCVHDWGGPIGCGYAIQHPRCIERMVVFNTTAFLTRHYPWRILACRIPGLGDFAIRRLNFFARGAVHMGVGHRLSRAVRKAYLMPYDSYANRIANLRFVQDIPLSSTHPSWAIAKHIQRRLAALQHVPMLICWGDRDFCFTEYFLDEWRQRFPHAEVWRFADAGHYVLEDAHDRIVPLVSRFLAGDAG